MILYSVKMILRNLLFRIWRARRRGLQGDRPNLLSMALPIDKPQRQEGQFGVAALTKVKGERRLERTHE